MYALLLTVFIGLGTVHSTATVTVDHSSKKPYLLNSVLPSTKNLQYVYAVFRHGIRSPVGPPYPNDPNKPKYPIFFPGTPGKLTEVGQRQMFKVGQNLERRYGDFVGGYTQEKVHVSATNISTRTTVSSLCVMAGQFPPSKPIFEDLRNWQPIPVWQNTSDFDKVYLVGDRSLVSQICPRYAAILRKANEMLSRPDPTKERQVIYKVLQNFTADPNVDNVGSVVGIFDNIQFEDLNGLPVPTWATQPQPQYKNRPLYPDLLISIQLQFFYDLIYPNRDKNVLQFYAGPIVNSVQEQLKINSNQGEERYRFHGTSDSSVFALLSGIGVEVKSSIKPGDGVLFEIHREATGPIVQVLYYRGLQHTFEKLTLPSCPDPCTVDNFIKTTLGLTPQQWQQQCFM